MRRSLLSQVVYDLQPKKIAVWSKSRKRPAIFALEIPKIPIRQRSTDPPTGGPSLADWAMENLNSELNLTAMPCTRRRIKITNK